MKEFDALQRFVFEHASIRGEIVHIKDTFQTIINQRPYPPIVRHLLGEALVSCLLLASSIQFEGNLNLQFQGDSSLPLLIVQCDHHLNIRAFAKYKADLNTEAYANSFLTGQMTLTINQYNQTQTYQSVVPIQSTSMSENLMEYFAQSEQIGTVVWLAIGPDSAAGMLLQLMPGEDTKQREEFWEYAVKIGETLTQEELLHLNNQTLLHRLYHETELRIFDSKSTRFACRCSPEKMQDLLTALGKEDAEALLKEQGLIDISCDFCNRHYTWDSIDVSMIFRKGF